MTLKFSFHLLCFLFVFVAYALQSLVIYPLEALVRRDSYLDIVSLMYLPHGVEVILAVMVGPLAFVYIFFAKRVSIKRSESKQNSCHLAAKKY